METMIIKTTSNMKTLSPSSERTTFSLTLSLRLSPEWVSHSVDLYIMSPLHLSRRSSNYSVKTNSLITNGFHSY
jgi:hypothetical protein